MTFFRQKLNTEDERYREVWDNLLEIILEINYLKNLYNVTKVGFLYDTAMSSRHNALENPNTGNLVNFIFILFWNLKKHEKINVLLGFCCVSS